MNIDDILKSTFSFTCNDMHAIHDSYMNTDIYYLCRVWNAISSYGFSFYLVTRLFYMYRTAQHGCLQLAGEIGQPA